MRVTSGSSPHTRGTPASISLKSRSARDHPRIRGEHHTVTLQSQGVAGIIPAYAGNTRGVYQALRAQGGSSPHTRGTPDATHRVRGCPDDHPRIRGEHPMGWTADKEVEGIIPAYAGNTSIVNFDLILIAGSSPHTRGTRRPRPLRWTAPWDHPRIRGEHGSAELGHRVLHGIIPAYAGNTEARATCPTKESGSSPHTRGTPSAASARPPPLPDHPRIRGEHHAASQLLVLSVGIIPAYAGNTETLFGESADTIGSSPHTRGTPCA